VAYGYQYIPGASDDEPHRGASAIQVSGDAHAHPLDRAAAAIAEAIAQVYRDIDRLRGTVPEPVSARTDDRATEAEAAG
jgi:hypothetical protein